MEWLLILSIGLFIWSVTALVDRYALLSKVKDKRLYLIFPGVVHLLVTTLIIPFFGLDKASLFIICIAILAGLVELVKLYYFFTALGMEEITRVYALSALTSFIVLFVSWFLLRDPLTMNEIIAFLLFLIGGMFLAFKQVEKRKRFSLSKAWKPIIIMAFLGAVEIGLLKYVFNDVGFWTGFYYSRAGICLGTVAIIFWNRKWLVREWNKLSGRLVVGLLGNQALATTGHIFIYLALALTNAALMSSAMGIQNIFIFLLAIGVTMWKPHLIKEDISRGDLWKKGVGTVLVVLAIYLLHAPS